MPVSRINRCFGMSLCMFSAVLGCASLSGCSKQASDLPDIAPVTGTVTMDGSPLENASVVFTAQGGATAFGSTDSSGNYELSYIRDLKGAGVGKNVVRITTNLEAPPDPRWKDPIPKLYNEETTLEADVLDGKDNVFDFALESKPSK
ncbi:MAG: carboxypeptidase-like regulatory domain-containing protein [Pirellulales bacterium]